MSAHDEGAQEPEATDMLRLELLAFRCGELADRSLVFDRLVFGGCEDTDIISTDNIGTVSLVANDELRVRLAR